MTETPSTDDRVNRHYMALQGSLTLAQLCLVYCSQPDELPKLRAWTRERAAESTLGDERDQLIRSVDELNDGILKAAALRLDEFSLAGGTAAEVMGLLQRLL